MMRWNLLVLILALSVQAQPRGGAEPPAAARFHDGARLYVDGDLDAAAAAVDAGLAEAPSDARLRALRELIRQQQPPGGGGEQPDAPDAAGDDAPPDEGDSDAPPDDAPSDGEGDAAPSPPAAPGGGAPGRDASMSRAEAEALLDAVGGDERLLLRQLRRPPTAGPRPERDW